MRKILFCTMLLLLSLIQMGFAKSPFPQVTGGSLNSGADLCSAPQLLDRAITETGVNLLDEEIPYVWTCSCSAVSQRDRKPGTNETCSLLNDCQPGEQIQCYSHVPKAKNHALCLKKPWVVSEEQVHGSNKVKSTYQFARFSSIYVIKTDAVGSHNVDFWKMDKKGCHPVFADLDNTEVSLKKCEERFNAFVKGGFIYPSDVNKDKYCDGGRSSSSRAFHLLGISNLSKCIEAYPQFWDKMSYPPVPSVPPRVYKKSK